MIDINNVDYELFFDIANYVGTIAFAVSGALKGIKYRLDLFGITLLGILTACGGGIIRDIILSEIPASFLYPESIYISIITIFITYFMAMKIKQTNKVDLKNKRKIKRIFLITNLVFDSIGLSIFALIGANKGINMNLNLITVATLATLTGVGGGIIRDILVREIPAILKEDIYAFLAFIIGSLYYILIVEFNFNKVNIAIILFSVCLITRLIVIKYKMNLPNFINRKKD